MRPTCISAMALFCCAVTLLRPAAAETTICTAITSIPYTITAPGVYCLNFDFNVSLASGSAISINASNVTLDMNRHLLSNLAAGANNYAYGISSTYQKNVVIKNGSVQGFFFGVELNDASPYTNTQGNVIEDIAAARNTIAMYVAGQSNLLLHNRISQTGGPTGALAIYLAGPDNIVRGNEITEVGSATVNGTAIYCYSCTSAIVEDNRIIGVAAPVSSVSMGIYLVSSSYSSIRNNILDKADASGVGYSGSTGISLTSSTDNSVVGNQINAFYYGIYAPAGSSAETSGNVVIGSSMPVVGTTPATLY